MNTSNLSTLSRSGRISQGGDIAPSEELWCAAVKDQAEERVTCRLGYGDVIRIRVIASKRKLRIAERRETPRRIRRAARRTQDAIQNLVKTLESLANPLGSLRVRLQAAPRYVTERTNELGVLLVHYSKPGSTQRPTNGYVSCFEQTEH